MQSTLDVQFDKLFNSGTICGYQPSIYNSYTRLLSTNLLNLAISIRVSLSDKKGYNEEDSGITDCYIREIADENDTKIFTIKDVCDKIIHADKIYKPIESNVQGAGCILNGKHNGKDWQLHLGITLFCEFILKWLQEIDE